MGAPPASLATAVGCLLAAAVVPASADALDHTPWAAPLRSDPAQRIFPHLPGARRAGVPRTGAARVVSNCNDSGVGSLRSAVAGAGDGDAIDLSQLSCSTITLVTGSIEVAVDNLRFEGPGRTHLAIDGNGSDRILLHGYGGDLTIKGVTLRNGLDTATGFHVAGGGCIASAGYLTLADVDVQQCSARGVGAYGGAIYAYSLATSNASITGNVADGTHVDATTAAFGGAAFVYRLDVQGSTISGNRAVNHTNPTRQSYTIGGAFGAVHGGRIVQSTIDSNVSQGRGGGIAVFDDIEISNSTISGNVAQTNIGGGLFLRWPSTVRLHNATVTANRSALDGGGIWMNADGSDFSSSIVADNGADLGNQDNLYGALARPFGIIGSNNLIGAIGPQVTIPLDSLRGDPRLQPLLRNNGPTRTHAPLPDSPVLDAGANVDGAAYDQRGFPHVRVFGPAPDIGAFEQGALPSTPAPVPLSRAFLIGLGVLLLLAVARTRRRSPRTRW